MVAGPAGGSSHDDLVLAVLLPALLAQLKGEGLCGGDDPRLVADLIDELLDDPDFVALATVLAQLDGGSPPSPGFRAVWLPMVDRLTTRAHHHLALLSEHGGWQLATGPPDDSGGVSARRRTLRQHWMRALGHFAQVLDDRDYLGRVASSVGVAEQGEDLRQRAASLWLTAHAEALMACMAPELSFEAWRVEGHWSILVGAPEAGEPGSDASRLFDAASTVCRDRVVQHVLDRARALAEPVDPLTATFDELRAPFFSLARFANVAGDCDELSVWAVERAVEWAWVLYKADAQPALQALLGASKRFGNHLERIIHGGGAFGRQSVVADYLLFVADYADKKDGGQERVLRRALAVCEGHRNARLMLSHVILNKADVQLLRAQTLQGLWSQRDGGPLRRAEVLIEEAEALHADSTKLTELKTRAAALRL